MEKKSYVKIARILVLLSTLFLGAGCSKNEKNGSSERAYTSTIKELLSYEQKARHPEDKIDFYQRAYDLAQELRKKFPETEASTQFWDAYEKEITQIPPKVAKLALKTRNFPAFKWAVDRGASIDTRPDAWLGYWRKGAKWREYLLEKYPQQALPLFMEYAVKERNASFFNQHAEAFKATGNRLVFPQEKEIFEAEYRAFILQMLLDAAQKADTNRMDFLLTYLPPIKAGAYVDAQTKKSAKALGEILSADLKNKDVIKVLLDKGYDLGNIDVEQLDLDNKLENLLSKNPEYVAFQVLKLNKWHGPLSPKALNLFFQLPDSVLQKVIDPYIDQGIEVAVKGGDSENALRLIQIREQTRPLTDQDYDQLFYWAVEHENTDVLNYAKKYRKDQDIYAMDLCKLANSKKLFVLYAPRLLKHIDWTMEDRYQPGTISAKRLQQLFNSHHPDAVLYIVKNYDLSKEWEHLTKGRTLLMEVCAGGNLEAAKYLIENKGADLNARTGYDQLYITMVGHDKTTEGGLSPIFFAAKSGNAELLRYLAQKGALINDRSNYGATPLMYAVSANKPEAVKALIEMGADVNATMNENLTAEELKALGSYREIATPYSRAKKVGNKEILSELKKAGARS